jgi:tetratricopeptide (TPR) repeat protein
MDGLPRVSAALIVRDESAFIESCLRSLVDTVDEIVIVDSGSRDDTIEIARRFPTQLYHFPWRDDFSAARNYALARAKGDWILYIDADECLEIPSHDVFRAVLADQDKVAWELQFYPRVGWTRCYEMRLFRNDPRIRFRGVIHERIHPAVEAVARSDGLTIGSCDVTLRHFGYEADQSAKNSRNIPLLRKYLADEPDRLYCWWHLGECYRLAHEHDAAIGAWTNGISRLLAMEADWRQLADSSLYLSLIKLRLARGEEVEALTREALSMFPESLALQWVGALAALNRGEMDVAVPVFERLIAIDADTFCDEKLSYDKALFRHLSADPLALCHFRSGRFLDAARLYEHAAQSAPDPAPALLKARLARLRALDQSRPSSGRSVGMADQASEPSPAMPF